MRKKMFFSCLLFLFLAACQKDEDLQNQPHDVTRPRQSDMKANGGLLRFTLEEKPLHDSFFEAQFTPRGEMFEYDNLQLYNYNLNSAKYPQLLISVNYKESELAKWADQTLPVDFIAFTAAAGTPTLRAKGEVRIAKVGERTIEGTFSGDLVHPTNGKTFPIRGEFKAVMRINV